MNNRAISKLSGGVLGKYQQYDATINTSNVDTSTYTHAEVIVTKCDNIVCVTGYDIAPLNFVDGSTVLASGLPSPKYGYHTFMMMGTDGSNNARVGINSNGDLLSWWSSCNIGKAYSFATTYIAAE